MTTTSVRELCLMVLVHVCIWSTSTAANVTVISNIGTFVGKTETVRIRDTFVQVSNFFGIRYAEPPVGPLRFRKPVAKSQFSEIQIVQEHGSSCIGIREDSEDSEDCLFLNIYVPEKTNDGNLSVMVYIHGGSFSSGSARAFDSNVLAAVGNIIVVTVNYRLSLWGFFSSGDSNSPGNYGLWDQRMAIQWVADNIETFGGDSDRITVFGESAGAASAFYQALHPPNKDLFKRVVTQSGSVSAFWAFTETHVDDGKVVAVTLGCDRANNHEMMDCLRELPVEAIISEISNSSSRLAPTIRQLFKPCLDGEFIKATPTELFNMDKNHGTVSSMRDTFASFGFLTGLNSGEGAYLLIAMFKEVETFLPSKDLFVNSVVPLFVQVYFSDLNEVNKQIMVQALISEYTTWDDDENSLKLRDNIMQMYSDFSFFIPQADALNLHSSLSQRNAYMYYLDTVMSEHVLPSPSWLRKPNHADDLAFIFTPNQLFSSNEMPASDRVVAESMITMWSNFAKTGNPNLPNDLDLSWQPYTSTRHSYLQITRNVTSANVKERLLADRYNFWTKVVPAIVTANDAACEPNPTSDAATTRIGTLIIFYTFIANVL